MYIGRIGTFVGRKFDAFLSWRSRRVNNQAFLFMLAFLTGLISGALAALLKVIIRHISLFWTGGLHLNGVNIPLLAIPVAGIVLTGIYQRYVLHANLMHGSRQLSNDLAAGRYSLPGYLTYAPMLASSLTLGFGGSAGSEGPIAYTGAAVGSNLGKVFRVSPKMMMIMVGCGAGAGIAGIFKAPMGGALFTLEVLKMQLTTMSVMALILACVTSAMTAYVLSGYTVDLSYLQIHQFDASVVPWIIGLGVVCGLYSVYYSYIMGLMDRTYGRIRNPWIKNGLSGLVLAVLLFIFPAMYGEGYGMMGHLLNGDLHALVSCSAFSRIPTDGWPIVLVAGGIVMTKCFAASASNCGGGVAGDFAPTLFAGCILGFFFASGVNLLFGLDLPVSSFAFMGMAGVMSGAIRAPFMALFLTVEMTNGYILFLPLLGVAAISYGVVRIFRKPDYYKE